MPDTASPAHLLQSLFAEAVASAQPLRHMPQYLPPPPSGRTIVLGAGKAAAAMAHAVELAVQAQWPATAQDLVIFLVSGGGSALLALPAPGISLEEKQRINQRLLHSGAPIAAINTVRKHLSAIKGGWLARACAPATVITIAISDVPGDDFSVIASGPTVPDTSTCADALRWLEHYGIDISGSLRKQLESGALETPKSRDWPSSPRRHHLLATPAQALEAARQRAESHGLRAYVLGDRLEGESSQLGLFHARLAQSIQAGRSFMQAPCVLLSGGETTVSFGNTSPDGRARGGRALEFCLGLAHGLQGQTGIWGLAADTDGIDGSSDAAGALVTPQTAQQALVEGLNLQDSLRRHLGHPFFAAVDGLIHTGPTFTNVNDFRAVLVQQRPGQPDAPH